MLNIKFPILVWSIVSTISIFNIVSPASAQSEKGVQFTKAANWKEVLAMAKAHNKNIMVDAYTTWCGPCKMMDKYTFPDSSLGALVRKDFIAIKIQMDSTKNDDPLVKSWYEDAGKIMQAAKINAFPTILFYNEDGELVFKNIGFKDAEALVKVASYAANPEAAGSLKNDLLLYQNGPKSYEKLPDLILSVREILTDYKLAFEIAIDYKRSYLDKLPDKQYFSPSNIKFIANNGGVDLLDSKDRFFITCYNRSVLIDSVLSKGTAMKYVNDIVNKEEIFSKLYKDDKAITKTPDWIGITKGVKKYKKIDADRTMLQAKIDFYYKIKDWETYTLLRSEQIKKYPPVAFKQNPFDDLNSQAWYVFLNCNERKPLERALQWSELSIELEMSNLNPAYYDTRANLLYKLGRTDEAIKFQELAVEKNEELIRKTGRNWFPDYVTTLEKMRNGERIWPVR